MNNYKTYGTARPLYPGETNDNEYTPAHLQAMKKKRMKPKKIRTPKHKFQRGGHKRVH